MAKLIDLFETREEDLYTQLNDLPEGIIRLTDAEPMNPAYEDQSNPISLSAQRDVKRMIRFSTSGRGLIFLAKQQALQSANTFSETRLYNPANITIHAVPFIHEPRHINLRGGIIESILESVGTEFGQPDSQTTLQKETVNRIELNNVNSPVLNRMKSKGGILSGTPSPASGFNLKSSVIQLGKDLINQVISPITDTISGINAQLDGGHASARPEISNDRSEYYTRVAVKWDQNTDQNPFANKPAPLSAEESPLSDSDSTGKSYVQSLRSWKKFGYDGWDKRISIGVPPDGGVTDGQKFIGPSKDSPGLTRYYKDLTQIKRDGLPFIGTEDQFVSSHDSDSINVLFKVLNEEGQLERVRFRAFLSGLQENVSPSYNENKYVGRYETFYMYNKVIRDIQFGLKLHAFSEEESEAIMQKMSYLSSLAYPKSSNNYLTPLIFKFTIGKLYIDQPALMMSVNHQIEDDISWDIDRQLPMTITSQMGIRLLDKEMYTYQSLRDKNTPFTGTRLSEAKYMPSRNTVIGTARIEDVGGPTAEEFRERTGQEAPADQDVIFGG